jgi:hypothetical protein
VSRNAVKSKSYEIGSTGTGKGRGNESIVYKSFHSVDDDDEVLPESSREGGV